MKILKKIALRIIVLIGILFLFNYLYSSLLFEKDLQKHSPIINLVRNMPDNTDILYVGESSNLTYSPMDVDKRTISEFIGDHYPTLVITDLTKHATHAGIYKTLLQKIPDSKKVKTVVVTLNLRSFGAQWVYSKLETPLQKSMVLLRDNPPLINRFLLSFKDYDVKTEKERENQCKRHWKKEHLKFPYSFPHKNVIEWDLWMATFGLKDSTGEYINEKRDLANDYIKSYAFQIDTVNHPRIKDFDEIIRLAKEKGWNLVFNLLAENTDKVKELVGDDLIFLMNQNRTKLVDYFTRQGVIIVDNLNSLEDDLFIDKDWPTEHYFEEGRKKIAGGVAYTLRKFHEDHYTEAQHQFIVQTSFFNDFEKNVQWNQEKTHSAEESYSGKYSSKTDKDNNYSIPFEYPFQKIPDRNNNSVSVSFMAKAQKFEHESYIVLEIKGGPMKPYWVSASLDKLTTPSKKWQKVQHTFHLLRDVRNGELISIYVLNSSGKLVYIDDLSIQFN